MDDVLEALEAQHAELANVLGGLPQSAWLLPTRCVGWDVADVVLHLVQSDDAAIASATGSFATMTAPGTHAFRTAPSVDEAAAAMVQSQRGLSSSELFSRWSSGAALLRGTLDAMDLSTRVTWVAGQLSARTLATTRLAETWIHTGDIAEAAHIEIPPTERLRLIARLAWRTLPYAFDLARRPLAGPVAFRLVSPRGDAWDFVPEEPAVTTIWGPATELCAVAARRIDPAATSLQGDGPDVAHVLALVRTYA